MTPHARSRLARWLVLVLLGLHLAGGLARQPVLVRFAAELAPLDLAGRGALAADERRNPQAATGQIELRRQIAAAARADDPASRRPSAVAYAWSWFVRHREAAAPGARVFLERPELIPYYYGNFLWAPTRLEVATRPRLVRDETTLAAAARSVREGPDALPPPGEARRAALAARGYRALVTVSPRGFELARLGEE